MEKRILKELSEMRNALVRMAGTSDLPRAQQLSPATRDRLAGEFKKLNLQSTEWVRDGDLEKYFPGAHVGAGKFIREEFGFTNFFIRGKSHYYNRADIQTLAGELLKRNVEQKRFMELKTDQQAFNNKINGLAAKRDMSAAAFIMDRALKSVKTTSPPLPPIEIIQADIDSLMADFDQNNLEKYIDIYDSNFAMVKFEHHLSKYISTSLKQHCKKWCEDFNYAKRAVDCIKSTNLDPTDISQ